MKKYLDRDLWRLLILYGRNTATYKIALAQCLCNFTEHNKTDITMEILAKEFFDLYHERLKNGFPQLNNNTKLTVMERVVAKYNDGIVGYEEAIEYTKNNAFNNVIPRFHNLEGLSLDNRFYDITPSGIILTDSLFKVFAGSDREILKLELDARWSLLESTFALSRENARLMNDEKQFYLIRDCEKTNVSYMKDTLNGYQEGSCFYCGETLSLESSYVVHVIPRVFICHDEPWNLVLAHEHRGEQKDDFLPNKYYIKKLIDRNERLIWSNHPLSKKIKDSLGETFELRKSAIIKIYNHILDVMGVKNVWSGAHDFILKADPFYKSMIAKLMKQRMKK